jgi:hypothetical protein
MHGSRIAMGDVIEYVVDDVLADALLARALQVDDRRAASELRRVLPVVGLELVGLDRDRQLGDVVVGAQTTQAIESRCSSAGTQSGSSSAVVGLPSAISGFAGGEATASASVPGVAAEAEAPAAMRSLSMP